MSKFKSFAQGYGLGQRMANDYEQAKQKQEMSEAANAQVTELAPVSDVTFADPVDGAPAVGTMTEVSPKQFNLLGKTFDQAPTESQQSTARNLAMAGIMKKYDPVRGMQMEQSASTAERDGQRFEREQKGWKEKDDEAKRDLDYRTGRERLLKQSPMGQHQEALAQFEQDTVTYNEAIKAGKEPQEVGLPPQKPNMQRPGPMQSMAGYAELIAHDYKYGKLNTEGLINFQDKMQTVEKENYSKALLAAQSGGTPDQIAKAFNSAGMQIEAKNVAVTRTKQANGPDQVTLNYKDEKGRESSINVMAELEAYDKAKQVYDRFYQSEGNRRGNEQLQLSKNADGRSGTQFAQSQTDRNENKAEKKARVDAGVALYKENNPQATEAELAAVKSGILEPTPTTDKNSPSEVKLAKAMVSAGLAPDMRTGLEMAITKKSQSAKEAYLDLMKPQGGIAPREEDVSVVMETAFGSEWRSKVAGNKPQGDKTPPKVNSPEELAKLPKGTSYTAPDGSVRTKQ